jgi:hypothetical protein
VRGVGKPWRRMSIAAFAMSLVAAALSFDEAFHPRDRHRPAQTARTILFLNTVAARSPLNARADEAREFVAVQSVPLSPSLAACDAVPAVNVIIIIQPPSRPV